jgi:glycosyltransferase involved in cell wall biosynthesis
MGAPQSRLYETALGLNRLGWEVEVITALPNYPTGRIFNEYKRKFFIKEVLDDITVLRFWVYASNSKEVFPRILNMVSFSLISLLSVFYLRKFRPNFILVESPPLLTGLAGIMLSRCSKAKMIINVSDIWPLSAAELGAINSTGKLYKLLEKFEHFLYRNAFGCTGQSQEIVDHVRLRGVGKAFLFRNGVDSRRFSLVSTKPRKYPLRIVYAGLLGLAQGILSICKGLQFDQNVIEFHIYGSGFERDAIQEYLMLNPKVGIFLHDPVPRNQVPSILSQFDLTLIPLYKPIYGAVPSKIYEAMAAGLPILFAGGGEGAKIIEKFQVGWTCPPSDFVQMQLKLNEIICLSETDLLDMRKKCIKTAVEVFDREIQIKNLHQWLINQN